MRDVIWWEAGKPSGCLCIGCRSAASAGASSLEDFMHGDTFNDPRLLASRRLRHAAKVIGRFRRQSVGNSCFVLAGVNRKCLVSNPGDVAERLKAAVC